MGFLTALVLLILGQTPPPSSGPVTVALVRGDRTLQPLARLEGEAWSDLPPAAATGPWSLWLFDDPITRSSPFTPRTARAITAAGAPGAASGCLAVNGLPPEATPGVAATAAVGLALTGTDAR